MSTIKQFQVTFDCAEPVRLAAFWCEVLGYVMPAGPGGLRHVGGVLPLAAARGCDLLRVH